MAGEVRWVSKKQGDGLGYDIASFTPEGDPVFVEVKTTCGGKAPFNIRQVEAGVGYRVSEEDSVPYGTVSVKFGDMWALKVNAGEDYVGAGLVLRR